MAAPLNTGVPRSGERRRLPRVELGTRGRTIGLRLVPGVGASIRNLSAGGASIEATSRLLPGTPVDLQADLPGGRWRGHARVLRCHVSALVRDGPIRYEAALRFDLARDPEAGRNLLMAVLDAVERGNQVPNSENGWVLERAATTRRTVNEDEGGDQNAGNSEV